MSLHRHNVRTPQLTCPFHPRYNPENGGEAAIKAGCRKCQRILTVYQLIGKLDREAYDCLKDLAETLKRIRAERAAS